MVLQHIQDDAREIQAQDEEVHVAGVLVHALPAQVDAVRAAIAGLPGALVHAAHEAKLVVTLEARSTGGLLDGLDALRALPGVLSALPVYQHNEPAATIDEEVSHDE